MSVLNCDFSQTELTGNDDDDDDNVNYDDRDRAELHRERHHRDRLLPPGDPGDAGESIFDIS